MTTDQQKPSRLPAATAVSVSVVALAVAGTALAFAAVDYRPPVGTEPPKITDWMQGWGSVAGVMAGLLAALFTGILLVLEMRAARVARQEAADEREKAKLELDRAAAVQRDAEKLHARMVAWGDLIVAAPNGVVRRITMTFGNYGPGPILGVRVTLVGDGALEGQVEEQILKRGILAPGEVAAVDQVLKQPVQTNATTEAAVFAALGMRVEFTDMHGRKWIRRDNGEPEQVLGGM